MLIHGSQELPIKYAELGCGLRACLFKEGLGLPTQPVFPEEQELGRPGISPGRELLTPTC